MKLLVALTLLACNDKAGSGEDTGCELRAWTVDHDGDEFGGPEPTMACAEPPGVVLLSTDCDDTNPDVHPGAAEVCNGIDDDCDDTIDPPDSVDATPCYQDTDGDGFATDAITGQACDCPDGFAPVDGDCDDADPDAWPGASETWYDGVDQDCDGLDDDRDADADGFDHDGYGGDDCDDADPEINPGERDICGNGIDEDCDGLSPGCGLEGSQQASDADLVIQRRYPGVLGHDVQYAGGADGDGWSEFLMADSTDATLEGAFHLVELSPDIVGNVLVDTAAVATLQLPDEQLSVETSVGPGLSIANVDLDAMVSWTTSPPPCRAETLAWPDASTWCTARSRASYT